jgi:hypothetical protein
MESSLISWLRLIFHAVVVGVTYQFGSEGKELVLAPYTRFRARDDDEDPFFLCKRIHFVFEYLGFAQICIGL